MSPLIGFGRYAGMPLAALPLSYLTWLASRELGDDLRFAVQAELLRRRSGEQAATAEEVQAKIRQLRCSR